MTTKLHNTKSNQAGKLYDGYSPSLQADSPAPAFLGDASEGDDAPADPPPDGPRYAALGDAVTVNVAEWIGVRLAFALQREAA